MFFEKRIPLVKDAAEPYSQASGSLAHSMVEAAGLAQGGQTEAALARAIRAILRELLRGGTK